MKLIPKYQQPAQPINRRDAIKDYRPQIQEPIKRKYIPTQSYVSQDNRTGWQKEQSQAKSQKRYEDYMEAKKMEKGLNNLNGFLNFVDAASLVTGAGSLLAKGAGYAGKKLIKKGIKPLLNERYVNLGNDFGATPNANIDRELSNVVDYLNQTATTKRLLQIDSELGTNYIKGRNWLLNEYSNGNIKLNKIDRFTGAPTANQSFTQPLPEFLSNPTYKNMRTNIVKQDPTPVVGHEIKHGIENYLEVLNNPNMSVQQFKAQHGTGKRLQALYDKDNIKEFKDFYYSIKQEFPKMPDEQILGTYKYLTNTSEFSSNLQPFISANLMRGRVGVPNYKNLEDLEDVMNNTFKLSIPSYHDPMMYSKIIYNHLVKDKDRFLKTFNKYGWSIVPVAMTSKQEEIKKNKYGGRISDEYTWEDTDIEWIK